MVRWVLISALTIGLIGTGYWGWQTHQDNKVLTLAAENDYQRAFHNLVYHIDQLEDHLGTVLAMNTRRQLSPKLAEIWRVTSLAQNELGELPLSILDLSKTEEFLYQIGEFSYKAAVRDLDKDPLNEQEYGTIKQLYHYANDVQKELRKTQANVIQQNIKWLDIEKEIMAQQEPIDNTVIDGFHMINEHVKGFSETEWGAGMSQRSELSDEELAKKLESEQEIDEMKAKEIAFKFLELNQDVPVEIEPTGKGLAYEAYSLTIDDPDHAANIHMDITKHGGHPVWIVQSREIKEQKLSLNDGSKEAEQFFQKNGFDTMQLVDSKQYDNIGIYEFAYLQDNVRVYTDRVVIEVALDDGSIIGFDGSDYLLNHKKRQFSQPKLSVDEARKRVNPNVEIQEEHLGIIKNDVGEEVLCYEFYGVLDHNTYRIFINAYDGQEELVEKLPDAEIVYDFS